MFSRGLSSFSLIGNCVRINGGCFRSISTGFPVFHYSNTTPHQKIIRYSQKMINKRRQNFPTSSRISPIQEDEALGEEIELSKDGRIICCWHPESKLEEYKYNYESTKPITDEMRTHGNQIEDKLKVQALRPVMEIYKPKSQRLMVRELMGITHTAKYTWFNRKDRRSRYKELDPKGLIEKRDREGL